VLFEMDGLSPRDRYKLLVSTVTPRPIAWVTTTDEAGTLNAAPYSFFNAVCGSPPTVVIGVGARPEGGLKDTGANIRATRQFVVNLVSHANAEAMNVTAIEFPHEIDELNQAGLTPVASLKVAPPRIAESPVSMECELLTIVEVGSQNVVFGTVLAIHVRDDCVLDAARCYIDTPRLDLLGRLHGAGWYSRQTDLFEMPRIAVEEWKLKP
jgi:flavin reductase (DIM6/NTAB) family NADH-FMN oxidoreductase RutF